MLGISLNSIYTQKDQKWLTQDYCVKQGVHVWDSGKCCPGLAPYLPPGMIGQQTCEPSGGFELVAVAGVVIVILLLLLAFVAYSFLHKNPARKRQKR